MSGWKLGIVDPFTLLLFADDDERRLGLMRGVLVAGGCRRNRLGDFNAKDVRGTEHIGAEDHEFPIGRETDVGFQFIIVPGHVHQSLGTQHTPAVFSHTLSRSFWATSEIDPRPSVKSAVGSSLAGLRIASTARA